MPDEHKTLEQRFADIELNLKKLREEIIGAYISWEGKVLNRVQRQNLSNQSKHRPHRRKSRNLRPVQYLNNVLEQDHRAIKRRVCASQHFRAFRGAWRTIAGYEAIHMIRKGQAYGSAAGTKAGLLHRFILGLFAASN